MRLYSTFSLNPQKVLFAIKELGLSVEIIEVNVFQGEQRTDQFTKMNPMQKLPVLDDNGFVLWESNAILAYLGEREGRLWPSDRRAVPSTTLIFEHIGTENPDCRSSRVNSSNVSLASVG